jgi:hypothetical protein
MMFRSRSTTAKGDERVDERVDEKGVESADREKGVSKQKQRGSVDRDKRHTSGNVRKKRDTKRCQRVGGGCS